MQVYPRAPLVFIRYQENLKAQIVVINLLVLNRLFFSWLISRKSELEKTTGRVRGFANTTCLTCNTIWNQLHGVAICSLLMKIHSASLPSAVIVAITCSSNQSTIVQDTKFTSI